MRLPRRVPWASTGELEQVCAWIYADENDLHSKTLAKNRISAWRVITPLPHALESTLALLVVILQDNSSQLSTYLLLRQSYAAAIIRLVNGLVDPLQLGVYARSIASIAAQIGLPPWLVELRHAATHEDLPSLELLREAARESMSWLLHNYFLPTINPSPAAQARPTPIRPLNPILKQYKNCLKITTRDASLKSRYRAEIAGILKDVERWVAEAKVAANVAVDGFGWDLSGPSDTLDLGDQDLKEKWALDRLCDALLEKGVLVPLSKKKRNPPDDTFTPPDFSVQLWSPLLVHLQSHHPDLPTVLTHRIVSYLLADHPPPLGKDAPSQNENDPSFDMCLARWAMWIMDKWNANEAEYEVDLKKDVTVNLITAFGPGASEIVRDRKAALALLQALCAGSLELESALTLLLQSTHTSQSDEWDTDDIQVMDERLTTLLSYAPADAPQQPSLASATESSPSLDSQVDDSAPGWRILDIRTNWRPSPIGVYVGA